MDIINDGKFNEKFLTSGIDKMVRKPKKRSILGYSNLQKNGFENKSYTSEADFRNTFDGGIIHFNTDSKVRKRATDNSSNPLLARRLFSEKKNQRNDMSTNDGGT
jgi:hypothetical protein